ncbi:hypothetical protein J6590_088102 [Homalodisca vitripennis]|nr:hypothetical protein J6590_034006 [Homalodisca vitripennis]KAG8309350.1 hypothetical protein J6590_088102 [Homalodisca vitripennis]
MPSDSAAHHVMICVKESPVQVKLEGQTLVVCETVKSPGVVLDSDLSFSDLVIYACQRALGRLRLFRGLWQPRLKIGCKPNSKNAKRRIAETMIIQTCCLVQGSVENVLILNEKLSHRVEVSRRFTRQSGMPHLPIVLHIRDMEKRV